MESLIEDLKRLIIEKLNLEDIDPADIDPDESLFTGELGIDSIDVLELIVMMEKEYGIKIESPEQGQKIFQTIRTIAEHIQVHQKS